MPLKLCFGHYQHNLAKNVLNTFLLFLFYFILLFILFYMILLHFLVFNFLHCMPRRTMLVLDFFFLRWVCFYFEFILLYLITFVCHTLCHHISIHKKMMLISLKPLHRHFQSSGVHCILASSCLCIIKLILLICKQNISSR